MKSSKKATRRYVGTAPASPDEEKGSIVRPDGAATTTLLAETVMAGEETGQATRKGFRLPSRERMIELLPFLLFFLVGAVLRFVGLGDKPLHHDESLHAYYSLQLLHNFQNYSSCFLPTATCYKYDPLLHGPFQFHVIALVYQLGQWLGAPEHGVNTTTVRIAAATLGSAMVFLPYFIRDYLGRYGAPIASFLLMLSPGLVYFSRFAREDAYMAFFTLLLVVALANYVARRKGRWLVIAALAFALSYATKEATFLLMAVFGSFFACLLAWELGVRIQVRARFASQSLWGRYLPKSAAPFTLLALGLLGLPLAKWSLDWMKSLSVYSIKNTGAADAFVQSLKEQTVAALPWLAGLIVLYVMGMSIFDRLGKREAGKGRLASLFKPQQQPVLYQLVTLPRWHWFCALLAGMAVFVLLFSVFFTNMPRGLGDGIWQGLYYWLQQQHVARGGQPWFYYLLLIPLYEQVGVVFGLAGLVYCLWRPTRFRLFLVYWFVGNVCIYSWAGEKMPWLMIHMTIPLQLLAALSLAPGVRYTLKLVQRSRKQAASQFYRVQSTQERVIRSSGIVAIVLGVLLLLPTVNNMLQVSYLHAADAPHEMMVYVQTSTDINIVMGKIEALDQKLDAGKQTLSIGVMADAAWPFYWYLRDYTNVCYGFPTGCGTAEPAVIISGGDNLSKYQAQYADKSSGNASSYLFGQYHLRTWWDEGYKPKPCVPGSQQTCEGEPTWGGVGPLLWLSYGDTPPENAQFEPGLASARVWNWWWHREAIGSTRGATDMGLFIRRDVGVKP